MTTSLRDAVKALNTTFAEPSVPYPLPDHLERTIEQLVDKYHDIDDYDSQKIHEELLSIFNKHVVGNSEKQGTFVAALRLLRPLIKGIKRLDEWWNLVIRPTIDAVGHKRDTIEDAREFLLGVLVYDAEDDQAGDKAAISAQFTKKLIDAYLARTRLPSGEELVSPEDEFLAQELETILVAFGRKNPKELLIAVDEIFVDRDRRLQALSLLSSFVRLQPPHLHLVLQTSLIGHLHTCLLLDNSSTVVDLALTVLIMFIPHITTTLVADLPRLFLIYGRILCWDQYNSETAGRATRSEASESDYENSSEPRQALHFDPHWDVIEATIDGAQSSAPNANYLFTFLYGLFPLNFMNFVRKPRRYLKMKSYQRADDLDLHQNLIRTRTEAHRAQHKLHPSFFTTTAEDELTDNRWLKSDPADLVSECLGLCIAVTINLTDPGPPPTTKLPALPKKSRSTRSRITFNPGDEDTLGNAITGPSEIRQSRPSSTALSVTLTGSTYHPDMKQLPLRQSSHPSLTDTPRSPKSESPMNRFLSAEDTAESPIEIRPQTPKLDHARIFASAPPSPSQWVGNSSAVPKVPSLQSFAQTLSRFPLPSASVSSAEVYNSAMLQREVMLLRNDLNFERYQKQKYVEQIGNLQRKHMSEAALETDTHSMMNKNRALKSRLGKADDRYEQLKKEMAASRNQAKRFEEQLTARLKAYREEEKNWQQEIQKLKYGLELARIECEGLKKIVIESELSERDSKNQLGTFDDDINEINTLRRNIADLESRLREYERRDFDYERGREEHVILQAELETTRMKMASADAERDRMRRQFEHKIMTLEANGRNAQLTGNSTANLPGSVQQMIDSAVAMQQSKFQQLKKSYTQLQQRFVEMEMRNKELEGNDSLDPRRGSVLSLTRYADDSALPSSRDSFAAGRHLARDRGPRRHDFAPAEPLVEESNLNGNGLNSGHGGDYVSDGPHSSGAVLTRTMSGGIAANTTNPLAPFSARGTSHSYANEYEGTLPHDFAAGPTDGLADTLRVNAYGTGGAQSGKPAESRAFGRGGAGNMKKLKDKDKEAAKRGPFRPLKGIK